eukprot:GEMP01029107.1.p1 GENE.GEMP01029107.1~~GEMP01029107.1.p1  ORF type:complete len:563 (+),score=53.75 GEMP01029107.1:41-1690(+)
MAVIQARYLNGSSIQLTNCESVGRIMVHVADLHKRFAQEVAVTCPDTGRDLTDPVSQIPPPVVQIVIKPEEQITEENLLSALRFHGQYEDVSTCARAYEMLQKERDEDEIYSVLLGVLDTAENGGTATEIQKNIVQTLLRVGVNLNCFLSDACENGNESRVKMLLAAGVPVECNEVDKPDTGFYNFAPPLSVAARNGELGLVKVLLAHKADVNRKAAISDKDYGTPLLFACKCSWGDDVVRELITHKAAVNLSVFEETPLARACRFGRLSIVELLLTNRANPVDERDRSDHLDGCLFEACRHTNSEIVKMLLDHGAKIPKDRIENLLSVTSSVDVAKILMAELLARPLCNASRRSGASEVVNYLLDCTADVNSTFMGETPLHDATVCRNLGTVSNLLARKCDVNKENNDGKTALALALDWNMKDLRDMLLKHGAIFPSNLSEKTFADQSEGESRNCSSASANKRSITDKNEEGSGYCSATSANKRHKKNEDETSGKKHFVCGNDVVQEKMERHEEHPSCKADEKIEENKSGVSGSGTSAGKEMKTLDDK